MPGASSSRQKQNLSLFGRLYYQLCDYLGISGKQIAIRAGISPGAISRASRLDPERGTVSVSRATAQKLYETMQMVATERGLAWDDQVVGPNFLRVAGYSTQDDQEESASRLTDYLSPERRNQPGGT